MAFEVKMNDNEKKCGNFQENTNGLIWLIPAEFEIRQKWTNIF